MFSSSRAQEVILLYKLVSSQGKQQALVIRGDVKL